jgi:hypothetical protein
VNEARQLPTAQGGADLDLGALTARIRNEAAQARAAEGSDRQRAAAAGFNWPQVQACLSSAARLAAAPAAVPALGRLGFLRRLLARLVIRAFLSLARRVTARQDEVNARLLEALRETAEGIRALEKQLAAQHERIRQLEAALWRGETRPKAS